MTLPRLSIVLPCHSSGAALCLRSVLALRGQTADPSLFEVVIGADGGDPTGAFADIARRAAAPGPGRPFDCRVADAPRPRGNVPHRNHARNAGWRASRGAITFILDADFILPPHAVEHVLREHDAALAVGRPAMFTPCLASVGSTSIDDWPRQSAAWVESGDPAELCAILDAHGVVDDAYSGFVREYTGPAASRSFEMAPAKLPEGMPIVWRGVLEELGGFDETFGEWGGDKEEMVDRLKGLAKQRIFHIRLLTSVMALHQPHVKDPDAWSKAGRKRQSLREARAKQILHYNHWWRPQVARVKKAWPAIIESAKS